MSRTENVEITVLCLIEDESRILLQNRTKDAWRGYTLPGGHVEDGESFTDAVIREVREETGLKITNPRLVGIKDFPIDNGVDEGRYIVILFKANEFTGEIRSSEEGEISWVDRSKLNDLDVVEDFYQTLRVMDDPSLSELTYLKSGMHGTYKMM
ncbi:MAG: 8-oxo-dGTP diphosphatase [Clostridiales bacterium]|nr:8-oxo-dGTP diphosphatase [Clostridiales bacterium]